VAQAVESLLCQHEALSSNSNPTKTKERKNQLRGMGYGCTCLLIPAFGRLRQGDHEFEARLGYKVRTFSKRKNKTKQKTVESQKEEDALCISICSNPRHISLGL
jgi:hypothetical protein